MAILITGDRATVENCYFTDSFSGLAGPHIDVQADEALIADNVFNPTVSNGTCISSSSANYCIIRNNRFPAALGAPILATVNGNIFGFVIEGNSFSGGATADAIHIECDASGAIAEVDISNNYFDSYVNGIKLIADSSVFNYSIHIVGNTILNSTTGWGIDIDAAWKVHIVGNHLAENANGIRLQYTTTPAGVGQNRISDNLVRGGGGSGTYGLYIAGVDTTREHDYTAITDNTFIDCEEVYVEHIDDGTYSGNYHTYIETYIAASPRVTIKNNTWNTRNFSGTPRIATLEVNGSDYATIDLNTIYGLMDVADTHHAISLSGTMTDAKVRFNTYIAQSREESTPYTTGLLIGASVSNTRVELNQLDDATATLTDNGTGTNDVIYSEDTHTHVAADATSPLMLMGG